MHTSTNMPKLSTVVADKIGVSLKSLILSPGNSHDVFSLHTNRSLSLALVTLKSHRRGHRGIRTLLLARQPAGNDLSSNRNLDRCWSGSQHERSGSTWFCVCDDTLLPSSGYRREILGRRSACKHVRIICWLASILPTSRHSICNNVLVPQSVLLIVLHRTRSLRRRGLRLFYPHHSLLSLCSASRSCHRVSSDRRIAGARFAHVRAALCSSKEGRTRACCRFRATQDGRETWHPGRESQACMLEQRQPSRYFSRAGRHLCFTRPPERASERERLSLESQATRRHGRQPQRPSRVAA